MKDLTGEWLSGCSPYLSTLRYDIDRRVVILECVDSPKVRVPVKRIILSGVLEYSEETMDEDMDDDCLDSVVGINWVSESVLCIHTEKKEVIVKVEHPPSIESIR